MQSGKINQQRELITITVPQGSAKAIPLGNNTKSSPTPLASRELRAERYMYQGIARLLIGQQGRADGMLYPLEWHRTGKCCHVRVRPNVGISKSKQYGKAFYTGLSRCGSVWGCPVCAVKVQQRRRLEIAQGIEWAYASGYKCVMVTLTFPHYAFQQLDDLILRQRDALRRLRKGRVWDVFKADIDYQGLIRSLELTYGDNGWHPHTHELWIVRADADADEMRATILHQWELACRGAGLLEGPTPPAFLIRSVDIHDNASTGDYLAKQDDSKHWGADREMSGAATKEAKKKGTHPFGFLRQYAEGDKDAGARFIQYIDTVTKRRCRQVYWSPGLKGRVGVDEVSDEAIAEREEDRADDLGQLTPDEWSVVIAAEGKARVLDLAEDGGITAVRDWIESVARSPVCDPKSLGTAMTESAPGRAERARERALTRHSERLFPDPLCLISGLTDPDLTEDQKAELRLIDI